jgi:ferredoxin-NADP reductase
VIERKTYTAELTRALQLSSETRHLEFAVQGMERFDFIPGQFLSLVANKEDREMTRAYSIASAPRGNAEFDLCLNRVDEGFFSNLLCDMREGEKVRFHGPHGLFTLRDPLKDSLFICTGTGIAPFRGFVEWLFAEPQRSLMEGHEFWLVYGTRQPDSIYYRAYFEQIAAQNPNFHYVVTLSRADESWTGPRGYVQDHVRKIVEGLAQEKRQNLHAYICGLNAMIKANRAQLTELGFERKSIIYERYD